MSETRLADQVVSVFAGPQPGAIVSRLEAERLNRLLALIPAGVYACDGEGRITYFNKRAVELWGRVPKLHDSQEKFCAAFQVISSEGIFLPPELTPMAEAVKTGKTFHNLEVVFVRPDGSRFFASVNIDVLRDESGRICGALNVFQDITNLKQATEDLRTGKQQLQAVVENTPECIKIVARDGTLLEMNDAGLALVQATTSSEVIGKSVYELIAPESQAAFREMNERVCTGSKAGLQFQIVGLKGARRWMETRAAPIVHGASGQLVQLALTRDITERKRAEEELRESEQKYRALFDSIDQGFCTVEVLFDQNQKPIDYRFLLVNAAFEQQTGIQNVVGRRIREIAPLLEDHWFESYGKVALTGEAVHFERPAAQLNRYFEVQAWRIGQPHEHKVAILFHDISSRKRAEESLRRSEKHWRTLAEALPNLVWTDLPNGQCDWLSSQWARYTGFPEQELLGLKWLDKVLHPDDRERTEAAWKEACADRAPYDLEYRIRRHDGHYRWFKTRGVPVRDESGRIVYWFGTCTDIEDLKGAEERERALVERALTATAKFEAVFNQSGIFAGIMDLNGNLREVNELAVNFCGYTREQVLNRPFWEAPWWRGSEESQARIREATREAVAGHVTHETLRYWIADGTERFVDFAMHPIRDESGAVRFLHPTGIDTTERKRIEEDLRMSEERFRDLADNISQLAWISDEFGTASWYNQRWYDYTGSTPEQMKDLGWRHIPHPDHLERVITGVRHCWDTGTIWEDTFPLLGRDGRYRWFLSRAIPIRDAAGRVLRLFGTNTDVTELREAQGKLAEANQMLSNRAAQLDKLVEERTASLREAIAQMEEFSYTVSHDLRAPLRAMQGYSEMLLKEHAKSLPKPAEYCLERIANNSQLLDRMVNDVLTFSRVARTEFNPEIVAVEPLVRRILEQYPGLQRPHAEIEIGPLPDVLGHGPSLMQAFSNLLNNAVKFVAPKVTPLIRVWAEPRDGFIRFWISDNGIGIQPQHQDRLFRMFERIQPNQLYEGTGVGLAIVKKAVERMGGKAGVESDGSSGSRFWFEVRAAEKKT